MAEPSGPAPREPAGREPDAFEPERPVRQGPGLRVALFLLAFFILNGLASLVLLTLLKGPDLLEQLRKPEDYERLVGTHTQLLVTAGILPLALALTLFFSRSLDRRPLRSLGFAWPPGTFGVIAAAALLALAGTAGWRLIASGWATFQPAAFDAAELELLGPLLPLHAWSFTAVALLFLANALVDEVLFRGYVFSTLRENFTWVHAAGLSTLLYGAFVAFNATARPAALVNIFLLAMISCALREKSGSLWPGAILQTTWNVALGCFFSLKISGRFFPRFSNYEVQGPETVTGGDWGPEGSWLMTGLLLVLMLATAAWVEASHRGEDQSAA